MPRTPAVGTENFRSLVEKKIFVDKTALIAELLEHDNEVTLITRPRRWGKTLNLSMLQHFFSPQVDRQATTGLFDQLKIASLNGGAYMQYQGQYPVIYVTFKDIKVNNFNEALSEIKGLFFRLYSQYPELETSEKLTAGEKAEYRSIVFKQADKNGLEDALLFLSTLLHKHYNKKVIILIDEYDTPLNNAYNHQFLAEMTEFMGNLFSKALKTNPALEKGMMTGILRVAKAGILSGLNNLIVYTVLNKFYAHHFGFTEEEVTTLVKECGLTEDKLETIKTWYNGYIIGNTLLYNPWSIMNYLNRGGEVELYWVESGGTDLIEQAIMNSSFPIKEDLEILLQGKALPKLLDPYVNYQGILTAPDAFWSLLLSAGYLKVEQAVLNEGEGLYQCNLSIPNREVRTLYIRFVKKWFNKWFEEKLGENAYSTCLNQLRQGDADGFTKSVGSYLLRAASIYDTSQSKVGESFYHGFVFGLVIGLEDTHTVRSNRESGLGRVDLILVPKATSTYSLAIILEFKHARHGEHLKTLAKTALQQIKTMQYDSGLQDQPHLTEVLFLGMAFEGKAACSAFERTPLVLTPEAQAKFSALQTSSMPDIMDTEEDPTPIHSHRPAEQKASEAKAEVRRPLLSLAAQTDHKLKLSDAETIAKVGKFASTLTAAKATTNPNDTISSTENQGTEKHKRQRTYSPVSHSTSSHLEKRG